MLIGGVMLDMTGSYDFALIISVIASVLDTVSIVLPRATNNLLILDWEKEHLSEEESQSATGQVRAPTSAD